MDRLDLTETLTVTRYSDKADKADAKDQICGVASLINQAFLSITICCSLKFTTNSLRLRSAKIGGLEFYVRADLNSLASKIMAPQNILGSSGQIFELISEHPVSHKSCCVWPSAMNSCVF